MNIRTIIIILAAILIAAGAYFYLSEDVSEPEVPAATTSPAPETATPPATTPQTQPSGGSTGQSN